MKTQSLFSRVFSLQALTTAEVKHKLCILLFCVLASALCAQNKVRVNNPEKIRQLDLKDTLKANKLYNQSVKTMFEGQYDSAMYYIHQSVGIAAALRYNRGLVRGFTNIGNIYNFKGEYKPALDNYFLALKLQGGINTPVTNAIMNGLAIIYYKIDNYPEALHYHFEGLKLSEQFHDSMGIYSAYINLGQVYLEQGKDTAAIENYNKALVYFKAKHDTMRLNSIYDCLGHLYNRRKDRNKAVEYFEQELNLAKASGDDYHVARAYIGMYLLVPEKPDFNQAFSQLDQALKIMQEMEDTEGISQCWYILGRLYMAQKNYPKAIHYLSQHSDMARKMEVVSDLGASEELLSQIYEEQKNFPEAYRHYKNYSKARDSIFNEANSKKVMQAELNYEFEKKQFALEQEQLKKDAIAQEAQKKQQLIIWTITGLSILLLVIAFLVVRQVRYKNREREMQLEQKLLRSQMNPHFIFNSLQAIQNFILRHNEKDAVKYLGSFASITRSVLENSRLESIPLRKELALLENYLQLQKLRFEAEFDYVISVDEAINIDELFIPPMLAQPFIENALEHGLSNTTQGLIKISFVLEKNHLLMEIEDNGRGMDKEKPGAKNHSSLAMVITKERIALMNRKSKSDIVFTIGEASPEKEMKGVKVSFAIPMEAIS